MRCYRSAHLTFNTPETLFSGEGSVNTAGRWNDIGLRVIYCSTSVSATVSERAYHSLSGHIKAYNEMVATSGRSLPAHYFDSTTGLFKIGEIEILKPERLVNLTTDSDLSGYLSAAGLPKKTVAEGRFDKYRTKKELWTRSVSEYLYQAGHLGFIAKSARSDKGDTVVIFENNIKPEDCVIHQIADLSLSGVCSTGKSPKKGDLLLANEVQYKSNLESNTAQILYL